MQALGAIGQTCVQLRLLTADRHASQLGAQHLPLGVDHQAFGRRLQQRPSIGTHARRLEVAVQHRAALAFAYRAMVLLSATRKGAW